MNLTKNLDRLIAPGEYPGGYRTRVRWGQVIRANSGLTGEQVRLANLERLVPLDSLGRIRGGIVTRANAYFLVRELPFDQIPARLRVTRSDLTRIAVIADGLDYIAKMGLR